MVNLLALHGNGGGASRYALCAPHFDPLKINFQAHTLPGFEGRPLQSGTWQEFLDDVSEAIKRLARPRWLMGHGIGASVALQYIQQKAGDIDGVLLHAPVGAKLEKRLFPRLLRPRWVREAARRALSFPPALPIWSRLLLDESVPRQARARFFREYGRCQAFSCFFDLLTADWFQALQPIDLPGVLLWGERERVLKAEHIEAFTPLLPSARVVRVPGWDHFPMLETPLRYAQVITQSVLGSQECWLGSGPAPLEPKAASLHRAVEAGLPVPLSAVVDRPTCSLPGSWAVRSMHADEDGQGRSRAGEFLSILNQGTDQLADAYERVCAASAHSRVLLMEMVAAQVSGVAFLESEYEADLINWTTGVAEELLKGTLAGQREELPRADFALPTRKGWRERLQNLLLAIRQSPFGDRQWDVEWADDGRQCWLVQIRPITSAPRRQEFFTAANQREILPDPPSLLMAGILRRCSTRLFDYYRQFDGTLPRSRLFLELFEERPFINLSLMRGVMIRWGLPTRLVTDNLGGADLEEVPFRPVQVVRKLPVHARMLWHQALALPATRSCESRLKLLAANTEQQSVSEVLQSFCEIYLGLVHQMMTLTAGMSLPLALLRAFGTLAEHNARFQVESSAMLRERDLSRDQYLKRFGHRGPYESDIARPRIVEDPDGWLAALQDLSLPQVRGLTWRGFLTLPIAWLVAPWVRARERLRSNAMLAFLQIRRRLWHLVEQSTHREVLLQPFAGSSLPRFWSLTPEELVQALEQPLPEAL